MSRLLVFAPLPLVRAVLRLMRSPKVVILLAAVAAAAILWMPAQASVRADGNGAPVPIVQLRTVVKSADAMGAAKIADPVDASPASAVSNDLDASAELDHRIAEPLLLVAGALVLGIALAIRERRQRRGYS